MTIQICGDVGMVKYRLGDICEIVSGSTPKTGVSEYWDGDKKWITPAEITDESYIITDSVRKLTELGVTKTGLSSFPKGTVILSSRAPIGKVAIAGCEMYCNQGFKNLICSQKIYNRYLYWFLKGNTEYLNSLGRGATFKEISKQIVASIEINVPDMEQQMQAAENLERVSSIIRLRKQELQKLDDLVKTRFVELFGDPLSNDKGWQKVSITEACHTIFGGGTPSKSHPEYFTGSIPWVSPKDMKSLMINDSIDHITEEAIAHSTTNLVPANSVLMVIRSGILKHTLPVAVNSLPVTINQDMKAFVPNDTVKTAFLMYFFKAIENDVLAGVRGVTADNIDFKAFQKRTIIVPPLTLQEQFAAFVEQTDKSKSAVQKALDEAQLLFDSLMQKYFG